MEKIDFLNELCVHISRKGNRYQNTAPTKTLKTQGKSITRKLYCFHKFRSMSYSTKLYFNPLSFVISFFRAVYMHCLNITSSRNELFKLLIFLFLFPYIIIHYIIFIAVDDRKPFKCDMDYTFGRTRKLNKRN